MLLDQKIQGEPFLESESDVYLDIEPERGMLFEIVFEDTILPLKVFGISVRKGDILKIDRIEDLNKSPENPTVVFSLKRGDSTLLLEKSLSKSIFKYLYLRKIPNIGNKPDGAWTKIPREAVLKRVFEIVK